MINRVYIKNLLSFNEVELELEKGLIVVSGASGTGKSIFINSILSSFGYKTAEAKVCELSIDRPTKLNSEVYDFDEEITLKALKKEKSRLYIDNQNISKKALNTLFKPFVKYISVRDKSGFESSELIALIDDSLNADKSFKKIFKEYQKRYKNYKEKEAKLHKIEQDESKLAELIEFAKFEIAKIKNIAPKIGEDTELLKIKQQLSKIDKIAQTLESANQIFDTEESVTELYRLLDKDSSHFVEIMNQLRADFEDIELLKEELEEVDIESILNRIEEISSLKKRYGSIEEALEYAKTKQKELDGYQNIEQDKSRLRAFLEMEFGELKVIANKISQQRKAKAKELEKELKDYLNELKLLPLKFIFSQTELENIGQDNIEINLDGSNASTLSGGEFNRVRLALMVVALRGKESQGVLILDEIDANVSGDESIAIASMISKLSKVYQIFAISHQAHLASKANQHLLISKNSSISSAILLDNAGRLDEIARIIGGESPNIEALSFAKRLLKV